MIDDLADPESSERKGLTAKLRPKGMLRWYILGQQITS